MTLLYSDSIYMILVLYLQMMNSILKSTILQGEIYMQR